MTASSKKESGFIFLEIIIAFGIAAVALVIFLQLGETALHASSLIQSDSEAGALVREEFDAARAFRDGTTWASNGLGSSAVTAGTTYHFSLTSASPVQWQLSSGKETLSSGFSRSVVFSKVSRDPTTDNIESTYNSSHDDPNTRKVTVTVSNSSVTMSVVTYLTNWQQ